MFELDELVEKATGDYGGPGVVVGKFELRPNVWRYVVRHTIEGGWGGFLHIYNEGQLRKRGPA